MRKLPSSKIYAFANMSNVLIFYYKKKFIKMCDVYNSLLNATLTILPYVSSKNNENALFSIQKYSNIV